MQTENNKTELKENLLAPSQVVPEERANSSWNHIFNEVQEGNFKTDFSEMEEIGTKNRLIRRYNKYFQHWKDFYLVLAVISTLSLVCMIFLWEQLFTDRWILVTPND